MNQKNKDLGGQNMTKLLKVNCRVSFNGYLPEADEDYDDFIMEVDRYYTMV